MVKTICEENNLLLISCHPVVGGDINEAFKLKTNKGSIFLKINNAAKYPQMFQKESDGLQALKNATFLKIPEVIGFGISGSAQYLLLEWLEPGGYQNNSWRLLGEGLAQLHRVSATHPGWHCDNYIGSLEQDNTAAGSWPEFYEQQRIMPMVQLLFRRSYFSQADLALASNFCKKLAGIFPEEPYALLHGDLWSGNYIITGNGFPALFDPAVYFGHREMDMGMTKLFGGFDKSFYNHYNEVYPLEKDWIRRTPITQLYPLLVHAVLFGRGYINQCRNFMKQWI